MPDQAPRVHLHIQYLYVAVVVISSLVGCEHSTVAGNSQPRSVVLAFTTASQSDWIEQISSGDDGSVVIHVEPSGSQLRVVSGHQQEKKLSRRLDASSLRRTRILAKVQVDFSPREESASVVMQLSVDRSSGLRDAWNVAVSQRVRTAGVDTLLASLDVPEDATSLSLELDVAGGAEARFGSPRLETTPVPEFEDLEIKRDTMDALLSLAQLIGYLRFFHPSDEVARTAWPTFEAEAIRRILTAKGEYELKHVMHWVVENVAPTARLYTGAAPTSSTPPPQGDGNRLTRWVRVGSGADGNPYSAFRTGIAEPSDVGVVLLKTVPSEGCGRVTVRLAAEPVEASPVTALYILSRHGSNTSSVAFQVLGPAGSGTLDGDIPSDATEITYGVRVGGTGIVDLTNVDLLCKQKNLDSFAMGGAPDVFGTAFHLYSVNPVTRCAGCLRVARHVEKLYEPARDEIDVPIGPDIRLRLPLAVWTDGKRTFPEASSGSTCAAAPLPPGDIASRLASALDVWITLRWFYPYFDDLHIDWDRELATVLIASARARSADHLLKALKRLVAGLRDDHAVVYRPDSENGMLPWRFQLVDSKLYLVRGVGEYDSVIPHGSVLESMDGRPADVVVREMLSTISAATAAWLNADLPTILGWGPAGVMVSVGVRKPDGSQVTVRVPRIERRRYLALKREGRPTSGSEVASGVFYVDLAQVDDATWKTVLPKLTNSRAVICDVRDGASAAGFQILAHFIDREIKSPYWDKPILSVHGKQYERTQLSIFPLLPRLSARLIFIADGGTASAPETVLQYARAAGLGVVVGEQTGGTNGDVAMFETLNGLRVRFTGLRAVDHDGTTIHGRGITPDVIAHPTAAAIRAGRDELLEAAISRAQAP